jgi:signal transduction histidine kinase
MNRLKQLKTYPFGLFLILEWIFLGATIFGEWPDEILVGQYASLSESSWLRFSPFFTLLCLIVLGLMGLVFGLCSTVVLILVNALLKECESRQKLDLAHQKLGIAHQKLREYAMLAEDRAILDERNRIAREIHDSLGHALTAQSIQLDNAIAFWQQEPTKAYSFLKEAKTLVTTALREIRYSVAAMRVDPLQDKDLATAINLLCQEFSQRSSIVPQCRVSLTYPLSNEVKTTLYRIVQEALTNISKHSEATEVMLELQAFPEHLFLLIKDNGKGFDPQQNTTGFGLQGMRERVTALAGYLQMSSDIDHGCRITINIPRKQLLIL